MSNDKYDDFDNDFDNDNNDDFEIDFIDVKDEEYIESEEIEEDYDEEDEFRVDFDYDEFVESEKKLTPNQKVNRVMIGLGVVILGFTMFYGAIIGKKLWGGDKNPTPAEEETTGVIEEETPAIGDEIFVSPYKDDNISEDIKDILNDADLDEMKTGFRKIDSALEDIIKATCTDEMTTYDKVRSIYDYMLVHYETKSSSFVDIDSILDYCSGVNYVSEFDMEMLYRTNKLISNKEGASYDYACMFALALRRIGLEAYYIEGEIESTDENGYDTYGDSKNYVEQGYVVVVIDDEKYIFDAAMEDKVLESKEEETTDSSAYDYDEDTTKEDNDKEENIALPYETFCKKFSELSAYTNVGVEESMEAFCEFETLADMSMNAEVSASNGAYTSGSVGYLEGYSESGNTTVIDPITIDIDDTVYLSGKVSGTQTNTWKLLVKVYDSDMNYVTEATLYNTTSDRTSNEVSYSPSRSGYMKLLYMVTDENGRTCTISVMVEVTGNEEESSTEETSTEETTEESVEPAQKPVIKLNAEEVKIYVGDEFDEMKYVESVESSSDEEAELYKNIVIDGYYDVTRAGTYTLKYTVKSPSTGLVSDKVTLTLRVLEKEPPEKPVITLKTTSATINVGDTFDFMSYVESAVDGEINLDKNVMVEYGGYNENAQVPGVYTIYYSVKSPITGLVSEKVEFTLTVVEKESE